MIIKINDRDDIYKQSKFLRDNWGITKNNKFITFKFKNRDYLINEVIEIMDGFDYHIYQSMKIDIISTTDNNCKDHYMIIVFESNNK